MAIYSKLWFLKFPGMSELLAQSENHGETMLANRDFHPVSQPASLRMLLSSLPPNRLASC